MAAPECVAANGTIPGLRLVRSFATEEEEKRLVVDISSGTWELLKRRRVQHFGARFSYAANGVAATTAPWPGWCASWSARLAALAEEDVPNQITVNSYEPGQGISWHCDVHSSFGDAIYVISLLADTVIDFRPGGHGEEITQVHLPRRSLLVMQGAARYGFEHHISSRKCDVLDDGSVRPRSRRVSVTFRTLRRESRCACAFPHFCDFQTGYKLRSTDERPKSPEAFPLSTVVARQRP